MEDLLKFWPLIAFLFIQTITLTGFLVTVGNRSKRNEEGLKLCHDRITSSRNEIMQCLNDIKKGVHSLDVRFAVLEEKVDRIERNGHGKNDH